MLTLWGRLNSHNVKKVAWFCEELALPCRRVDTGGAFGMDAAYLAKNPNALIPTIEDGDLILWESNAILRYLAGKYDAAGQFWPHDPAQRARADRWMDWQFAYAPAQFDAFINLIRTAPADRNAQAIARSAERTAKLMAILDRYLAEQPWLSGPCFGVGDVPMGVYAHTWFSLDIDRPALPHVADWYERLKTRPGYAANVMIPLT